jgi:hypothetical protein
LQLNRVKKELFYFAWTSPGAAGFLRPFGREVEQHDRGLIGVNHDSLGPIRKDSVERGAKIILAGFQAGDLEMTGGIGMGGVGLEAVRGLYGDGGADNWLAMGVNDRAGKGANRDASVGCERGAQQDGAENEEQVSHNGFLRWEDCIAGEVRGRDGEVLMFSKRNLFRCTAQCRRILGICRRRRVPYNFLARKETPFVEQEKEWLATFRNILWLA